MKCSVCENDLAGDLDTFGSIQEPLCWICFITDALGVQKTSNHTALREQNLKSELSDIEGEIDELQDRAHVITIELKKIYKKRESDIKDPTPAK